MRQALLPLLKASGIFFLIAFIFIVGDPTTGFARVKKKRATRKVSSAKVQEKKSQAVDPLDSPFVKKLQKRQARRRKALNALKIKGVIGESETGLIAIRDMTGLDDKDRKRAEKLIQVENNDRNKVIQKMKEANGLSPSMEKLLRLKMFESYNAFDSDSVYFFKNNRWQKR